MAALDAGMRALARDKRTLMDPKNGVELRTFLESLRAQLWSERSSYDARNAKLSAFFSPYTTQWDPTDTNVGNRRDSSIINETGLLDLRVCASGMQNGLSNPTKKWFNFVSPNQALMQRPAVVKWHQDLADIVRASMLRSNYYDTLLEAYWTQALYGTVAFQIDADPQTDFRCRLYPTGSYALANDATMRVYLGCRVLQMTPAQMVEQFGIERVSDACKTQYLSNGGGVAETVNFEVAHFVMRSDYFGEMPAGTPPWMSIYYEISSFNEKEGILRRGVFLDCPLVAGRWTTKGENVYGESPALDVLGSVMSLQAWEIRLAQAAEKQFNPSMVAHTSTDPRRLTVMPGEFSFVDFKDGKPLFQPAYQIDFKLDMGIKMVERIENRIHDGMFRNVFQAFTEMDRRQITAEEIRARAAEKLQVLGAVVERNLGEIHAPSIHRIVSILSRIPGKIPPAPPEMKDQHTGEMLSPIKIEFDSILGAAAKMLGINNIQTVVSFITQENALDQGLVDVVDLDKTSRKVAELAGMPAELLRTPEEVTKLRADRAHQQQQQQLLENSQGLAAAAKTASETPAGDGSTLLSKVAPNLAGGQDES